MSRDRSKNFTEEEKAILVNLALKYSSIIENKKTDCITAAEKARTWENIAKEFNASSSAKRNATQLRSFYKNSKSKLKKNLAADEIELYKTGGGAYQSKIDENDPLLSVIIKETTPIPNKYDNNAGYIIDDEITEDIFDENNIIEIESDQDDDRAAQSGDHQSSFNKSFVSDKSRKRKSNQDIRIFVEEFSELKKKKLEAEIEKNEAKTRLYLKKLDILQSIENKEKPAI